MSQIKWGTVLTLSFAHMMNDLCTNMLPQLIPFLIALRGFSITNGATLVSAFTITSSLLQPVFGYLVDQKGHRWLVYVGTMWMSLLLGISGIMPDYPALLVVAALSGMGTAAFHPQAMGMVGQVSGNHKGFILAFFIAAGNIGLAISPLILLPLFHYLGIAYTWIIIIPGIITAVFLYWLAPRPERHNIESPGLNQVIGALKKSSNELSKLMLVVAVRSLVHTGLMTLLPLYLLSRKFSPESTGYLMFSTLVAGAAGGLIGGYISDEYGRKPLIVGSLLLSSVFFYGFLYTSGMLSFVLLGLGGMSLLSSFSVIVAASQEVIPDNKALASGLSVGFAVGMGGLAVSIIGKYADIYGVSSAVHLVFLLPLAAALLGMFLTGKEKEQTALDG
ncbi:major facilitator superfamily MFS_1 [Desulfofarcimen acetoxidans DSM 771]|uniref:Major facilitator superfamily MFS_1 n=1 Tax=Desulfofarcimen acetoxidans (strain ATCC 49208 / DSM 771 / KCTC 5769 / VKM B-1644 / 5575) TaxID=485916 RepID=C8W1W3_DESAS|nr:MFS transporter [Desulfofarcimen acetoxidans]ACV63584.1 major facilitator superfamily MFS_1 [Desulfofarcimen acetoxidans DSM 771]